MANKKHSLGLKLLRLYGRAHERNDFPGTKWIFVLIDNWWCPTPWCLCTGPCSSHVAGILPNLNIEGRCEERFLDDALHKKVRSISSSVKKMDEEFKLLHEKKLSPSPRVLKEYRDQIETAEQKVSSLPRQREIVHCVHSHMAVCIKIFKYSTN